MTQLESRLKPLNAVEPRRLRQFSYAFQTSVFGSETERVGLLGVKVSRVCRRQDQMYRNL